MIRILSICGILLVTALALEKGQTVYVKRDQAPLLSSASPDAETVAKLTWGKSYAVKAVEGRWVQLSSEGKVGWVYFGNLVTEKPPDANKADALPSASTDVSTSLASRGLDKDAKAYAARQGKQASANDLEWLEKENASVSKAMVTQYLKDHQMGEYAGAGK